MNDRVSISIEDGVAEVRLTRPDRMNALDEAMQNALVAAGERLKADRAVRAVVLSGEGKAFCAGLDMGRFASMATGGAPAREDFLARTHGPANFVQAVSWVWREVPVPVLAAVHGHALAAARAIAAQNPDAIRAAKALLNNAPLAGPEAGLLAESRAIHSLIGSPNQVEAVKANLEKRAPRFSDPQID